jgi:tRNA (guanine-N7-)-methyltransferase
LPNSLSSLSASIRFYGRRRGKALRPKALELLETKLPDLTISIDQAPTLKPLDISSLFSHNPKEIWLEIGFGAGEHLAWQAFHHSHVGLIGCEVFRNGIASLLQYLDKQTINNVRIYPEDARLLFPNIPESTITKIFILFPDPWPKKRHKNRRFIHPDNLTNLSRIMKKGGELRIATDDPTYQKWLLEQMSAQQDFVNITVDHLVKPEQWPETRYEEKARKASRIPHFYVYRK